MHLNLEFDTCTPRLMIDTEEMNKAVVALMMYGMKLEGQNFDVSITVVPKVTITYCNFDDLVECAIQWHPLLAEKRRAIRSSRKAGSRHIYRGSILLRYFLGGRTFGRLM